MSRADLTKMVVPDLVDRFAAIALRQDEAIFNDDNALYSRLFWQMEAV